MKPQDVNPKNFTQEHVVYDDDDFSIAYGTWEEDGSRALAMRWNGSPDEPGYPKTFGHPVWFIVTPALKDILLSALLSSPSSNKKAILTIMNQ